MATKRSPKSPKSGNDLKTAVIIVLLLIAGVQGYLLISKQMGGDEKTGVNKKPVVTTVTKPVETPTPITVGIKPKKVQPPTPVVTPPPTVIKKVPAGSSGKIAIIIDDWGYTTRNCHFFNEIDAPLAIAILPNLRNTDKVAQCAKDAHKNIMLHLPLEPYHNNDPYPDNYLITTKMKPNKADLLVTQTLAKMPYIEGVNNHMGSKATEDKRLMKLIFSRIKGKKLFFVDSMTAPNHSVCAELADGMKIPFAQRDVFLDNINKKEEIVKQFASLMQKARKKGYAIAIGHDRELTMQVIKEQIDVLREQGFEIVPVTELLRNQ